LARCVGMLPYHSDQIEKVGMPQAADIPSIEITNQNGRGSQSDTVKI
jgi:hypothetical protein